jgi:hypothetical protein
MNKVKIDSPGNVFEVITDFSIACKRAKVKRSLPENVVEASQTTISRQ